MKSRAELADDDVVVLEGWLRGNHANLVGMSPAMRPSSNAVAEVIGALPERRQREAAELVAMMGELTGEEPAVWAGKIIGFGQYRYRYDSGHEGNAPLAAFAPTARHHTVYLIGGYQERYPRLVERLVIDPAATRGRPRMSVGCLYLSRLDAVDLDVLRTLIERSARVARAADVTQA